MNVAYPGRDAQGRFVSDDVNTKTVLSAYSAVLRTLLMFMEHPAMDATTRQKWVDEAYSVLDTAETWIPEIDAVGASEPTEGKEPG